MILRRDDKEFTDNVSQSQIGILMCMVNVYVLVINKDYSTVCAV